MSSPNYCQPWGNPGWYGNWRAEKRMMRKSGMAHPCNLAYNEGRSAVEYPDFMPPRLRTNPYPPGRRRAEYDRGRQEMWDRD